MSARRVAAVTASLALMVGATSLGFAESSSTAPSHSRSYRDGYASGVQIWRSGNPMGDGLCDVFSPAGGGPAPKGDNPKQYMDACFLGYLAQPGVSPNATPPG